MEKIIFYSVDIWAPCYDNNGIPYDYEETNWKKASPSLNSRIIVRKSSLFFIVHSCSGNSFFLNAVYQIETEVKELYILIFINSF